MGVHKWQRHGLTAQRFVIQSTDVSCRLILTDWISNNVIDVRWWVIVISRSQYGGELGLLKQNCSDAEPLPTCHTYLQTQITAFVGPRSKSGRSAVTSMLLTIFRRSLSTTLSSPYVVANPSVVCLSVCLSVTLVHRTQKVELFGNRAYLYII